MLRPGVSVIDRARGVIAARAGAVWRRDRAGLRGLPALGNRLARVAILVVRGVVVHRVSMLAAALTYFTVFSIIPMLVVMLWILRMLDYLPVIAREVQIPSGNEALAGTLEKLVEAAVRTSEVASGVVGLVALLFAVSKMFSYTERALHIISGSEQRAPKLSRLMGYVALMLLPPLVLVLSTLFVAIFSGHLGRYVERLIAVVPWLGLAVGAALGLGVLWLAVTIFYSSAVRARIPFSSAAVGASAAAVALAVIFWMFTGLEAGAGDPNVLQSGLLGVSVFLLWIYASWWALLAGAEIAVAHRVDRVLVHGAVTFRLDAAGERQAAAAIMVRATRVARVANGGSPAVSEDELARELRLPPALIRQLCARLVEAGLLAEDARGLHLGCDPDSTPLATVVDAVERDPALEPARRDALAHLEPSARAALASAAVTVPGATGRGPTLRQLTDEQRPS
jgi:membrane protein